jgi:adenosylhomocysteine nucleosidase
MTRDPGVHVEVLIVTALTLERQAVRAYLAELRTDAAEGLAADRGRFEVGRGYEVAVIQTGAGNVDAAVLTARAEEVYRPDMIFMVGIAGSLKDVQIGDVVASSKIYWLEGGKQNETFQPRPEFAAVSTSLVQLARVVAADGEWLHPAQQRGGGAWPGSSRLPAAQVAPIVAGEKLLAYTESEVVKLARSIYGDALAVAMEEFGVVRGGGSTERARALAVRGISDLVDGKAHADAAGSQPLAAANAAAFTFELLRLRAHLQQPSPVVLEPRVLAELGAALYPPGPHHDGLWQRAGGDASRLRHEGTGRARWWHAAVLLDNGGGGADITVHRLLETMAEDFPNSTELQRHFEPPRGTPTT